MPNGYPVCPTCGCPPGPWQGAPAWAGPSPAWTQGPGWTAAGWAGPGYGGYAMPGPAYGAGWGAGAGAGYAPAYAPTYYGGLPTDSEIEEMIYDAMDADPLIPFDANIDVGVEAGTVYLRGEAPSKRIKHAAGDDAWWIPGVVDVHNEVKVTPRRRARQEGGEQQVQE